MQLHWIETHAPIVWNRFGMPYGKAHSKIFLCFSVLRFLPFLQKTIGTFENDPWVISNIFSKKLSAQANFADNFAKMKFCAKFMKKSHFFFIWKMPFNVSISIEKKMISSNKAVLITKLADQLFWLFWKHKLTLNSFEPEFYSCKFFQHGA